MATQEYRSGIDDLRDFFEGFNREMSAKAEMLRPHLMSLLISRVTRAIDEGMAILDGECSRRMLVIATPKNRWSDASLVHALELDLNREENTTLRWLLISYWVVLCNFDAIALNVETLVASHPEDFVWLVGGALWVQWASGQPTTHQLREALARVRARHSALDAHLAAVIAGPPSVTREAAEIAERLLADPTATLLTSGVPGKESA